MLRGEGAGALVHRQGEGAVAVGRISSDARARGRRTDRRSDLQGPGAPSGFHRSRPPRSGARAPREDARRVTTNACCVVRWGAAGARRVGPRRRRASADGSAETPRRERCERGQAPGRLLGAPGPGPGPRRASGDSAGAARWRGPRPSRRRARGDGGPLRRGGGASRTARGPRSRSRRVRKDRTS